MSNLKHAREAKEYTQEQMASLIGIAVSSYNMYEKGNRNIPANIADRISEIVQKPKEEIFLPIKFTISK